MLLDFDTIAASTQGRLAHLGGRATGVCWDSRQISSGDLYVALSGEHVDGHEFCIPALRSGAAGVLVSHEPDATLLQEAAECGAGIVQVTDCMAALADLARAWRSRLQGTVVALTGSSGKTSTKALIRDVLCASGSVCATLANQNNELGVPATLLRADEDTRAVVVEMGMRGPGQIADLCRIARPTMGLVTNVGVSHIELLGSQDSIARAKAELFAALPPGATAFANSSDSHVNDLLYFGGLKDAGRGVETVLFDGSGTYIGASDDPSAPIVFASDVSLDGQGRASFLLHLPEGQVHCHLQLKGRHSVHNACAAAAVGRAFGLSPDQIAAALEASQPEPGRQQTLHSPQGFTVINDAYNANPDSTCAALDMFASLDVSGRRIAVLGDMGELGEYTLQGHERVGTAAAAANLDYLLCVGDLARTVGRQACGQGMGVQMVGYAADGAQALDVLAGTLEQGDCVLVKASHAMGLDALAEGLVG